jgi:diguanylate cyclase (GGDEF)-like protein
MSGGIAVGATAGLPAPEGADGIDIVRCRLALARLRSQLVGNLANAAVAVLLLTGVLPGRLLAGWATILLATLIVRLLLGRVAVRRAAADPARALRLGAAGSFATGCCWAALALLAPPFGSFATGHHLVALFAGISAGAAALNATHRPTVLAFLVPLLAAVAFRYASALDPPGLALAGLVVLYGFLLAGAARSFERSFVDAHRLRLDRERLIGELRQQAARLEAASRRSQLAEARLQALADHAPVGIVRFDPEGRIVYANGALGKIWGESANGGELRLLGAMLGRCREATEPVELDLETPSGRKWLIVEPVRLPAAAGETGDTILWVRDVTSLTRTMAQLDFLAHHDALTGVANRTRFRERLATALAGAGRGTRCALLLIDLDGFKPINDRFGHAAGDAVLVEVARRLLRRVRESDLVARLGGDEFAVLLGDVPSPEQAESRARELLAVFDSPVPFDGRAHPIAASLGLAVAPDHADTPDALLRAADAACYRAKERPGTALCVFRPGSAVERAAAEDRTTRVARAVAEGRLEPESRPWVDARSGEIVAVEVVAVRAAGRRVTTMELWPALARLSAEEPVPEPLLRALAGLTSGRSPGVRLALPVAGPPIRPRDVARAFRSSGSPAAGLAGLDLIVDTTTAADGPWDPAPASDAELAIRWFVATGGAAIDVVNAQERGAAGIVLPPELCRRSGPAAERALAHIVSLAHELGLLVLAASVDDAEARERVGRAGVDLLAGEGVAAALPESVFLDDLAARGTTRVPDEAR